MSGFLCSQMNVVMLCDVLIVVGKWKERALQFGIKNMTDGVVR